MTTRYLLGFGLIIVGVIAFVAGLNATDSLADRFSHFLSGHYTDETVWYLIGGGAAFFVGLSILPYDQGKGAA